jgi:hypothetical protein
MVWFVCKLEDKSKGFFVFFVPMAYRFKGFGVVSKVKGLLDDYKKLVMNMYLVNVLNNLALHLLFDVSIVVMSLFLLCNRSRLCHFKK